MTLEGKRRTHHAVASAGRVVVLASLCGNKMESADDLNVVNDQVFTSMDFFFSEADSRTTMANNHQVDIVGAESSTKSLWGVCEKTAE